MILLTKGDYRMELLVLIIIICLTIFYIDKTMDQEKRIKKKEFEKSINEPTPQEQLSVSHSKSDIESNIKRNFKYKNYYRPKRYLITMNELKFYNVLMEIAKELDLVLFSQVSLYNILETKQNLDYKTKTIYFNKIASKTIDFVLVDKKDCRIKLCIELDDNTHNQRKRIERDIFINELFNELEINLLRYPTYNVYYKETLKNKIQEKLKDHYYID